MYGCLTVWLELLFEPLFKVVESPIAGGVSCQFLPV